ncbi:hypothetical protein Esti_005091 [Eimeria stiedai]
MGNKETPAPGATPHEGPSPVTAAAAAFQLPSPTGPQTACFACRAGARGPLGALGANEAEEPPGWGGPFWLEAQIRSVRRQGKKLIFADAEVLQMREAEVEEVELLASSMSDFLSSRKSTSSPPSEIAEAAAAAPDAPAAANAPAPAPAASPAVYPAAASPAAASAAVASGPCSGGGGLPVPEKMGAQVQLLFSGLEYWSIPPAQPPQAAPTTAAAAATAAPAREARAAAGETLSAAAAAEGAGINRVPGPLGIEEPSRGPSGLPLSAVFDLLPHLQTARLLACRGPPSSGGRGAPTLVVRLVLGVKAAPNFFAFSRVDRLWTSGLLSPFQAFEALGGPPVDVAQGLLQGGPPSSKKLLLKAWARRAAGLQAVRANRRQRLSAKEMTFLLEVAALRAEWPITEIPAAVHKGPPAGVAPSPFVEAPTKGSTKAPRGAPESQGGGGDEGEAEKADVFRELLDLPVSRRTAERVAWLGEKKLPQVSWIVERIKPLYAAKEQRHAGKQRMHR